MMSMFQLLLIPEQRGLQSKENIVETQHQLLLILTFFPTFQIYVRGVMTMQTGQSNPECVTYHGMETALTQT